MTTPGQEHTETSDTIYNLAYMSGGGARGELILGPVIFGEVITRKPFSTLFNGLSGDSVGSTIASTLNTPRAPGSAEPRYNAFDAASGFRQVIQHALPRRTLYYPMQALVDTTSVVSERTYLAATWGVNKIDHGLSSAINAIGRNLHRAIRSKKPYNGVDIKLAVPLYEMTFKPVMKGWIRAVHSWAQACKYNVSGLYEALDATYRYETTGDKVLLGDTIVSHHVTAMNASRDRPAFMAHTKDIDGTTLHVSDPTMELADIATGSSAAQTIFDDHKMQHGEQFSDIAHANTAFSPMRTIKTHLNGNAYRQRVIIFNTGEAAREDLARMSASLFLRQMMSSEGSPLMRRITSFISKRDMGYLQEDWGRENVVSFDIPLTRETVQIKYADSPKVVRMARILGFDLLARDEISETERLPTQDIFDTSDRTMKKLSEWGWDMVWHNADAMVREYRGLLQNAVAQGRVDAEEARKTIADIDWLYPLEGAIPETATPPYHVFPNVPELMKENNLVIDFQKPKGLIANLRAMFNGEAGAKPIIVRHVSNDNHRTDIQQQHLKYMEPPAL